MRWKKLLAEISAIPKMRVILILYAAPQAQYLVGKNSQIFKGVSSYGHAMSPLWGEPLCAFEYPRRDVSHAVLRVWAFPTRDRSRFDAGAYTGAGKGGIAVVAASVSESIDRNETMVRRILHFRKP